MNDIIRHKKEIAKKKRIYIETLQYNNEVSAVFCFVITVITFRDFLPPYFRMRIFHILFTDVYPYPSTIILDLIDI